MHILAPTQSILSTWPALVSRLWSTVPASYLWRGLAVDRAVVEEKRYTKDNHTLSALCDIDVALLERSPFKVLLVSSACYISSLALIARRFSLVAFETLCFACNTACGQYDQPGTPCIHDAASLMGLRGRTECEDLTYHSYSLIV